MVMDTAALLKPSKQKSPPKRGFSQSYIGPGQLLLLVGRVRLEGFELGEDRIGVEVVIGLLR